MKPYKSTFIRIFQFMQGHLLVYLIAIMALSIVTFMVQYLIAMMFMRMFAAIETSQFDHMLDVILDYMVVICIMFLIAPFFTYFVKRSAIMTTAKMRETLFQKLKKLPNRYFKEHHSGDVTSRMTNDLVEVEKSYTQFFVRFITNIIAGIGTTIVIFILEWRLGLIAVSGALITLFINLFYSKILRRVSTEVQEKLARLNERLSNLIAGVHVIRVFNIQKLMLHKFYDQSQAVYHKSTDRVHKMSVMQSLNSLVGIISFVGIATVGSYLVINGTIDSVGIIIAVVQLQNGINMLVYTLGNFVSELQGSLAAGDRVFEILDEEEEPVSYETETILDVDETSMIVFDQVSFNYAEDEQVLTNLSFRLPTNQVYALVGPSGGGKSTIFKLILNFYPPKAGDIAIDGVSISQTEIQAIRDKIAYVPQDAYLYTGTIKENIAYGKAGATEEEIIQAAKLANAHDFILKLDKGYESMVGENGTDLSGGQRQRIAIARAVLKDAPILLLDEATSALDSESEELVQEALEKLMQDKTTLIIAHRLSTVQHADQILVINNGQVEEQGSHDELLNVEDGLYAKLYYQQFVMES